MKNALILHGLGNNHTGNWFPWLEKELKKLGYKVWVPDLPTPDKPNIERNVQHILPQWKFDQDSVIVGHSGGSVTALGILNEISSKIVVEKAVLVAGFTYDVGMPALRELFITPFNWGKIKKQAKQIVLYHSDTDPYVPLSEGEKLRDVLDAELVMMQGEGHFNIEQSEKYKQFPEILATLVE